MNNKVRVALVGVGGYGESYLNELFNSPRRSEIELVGAVDPSPDHSRYFDALKSHKVRVHRDLSGLYAESKPDLVMLATPIHLHAPQTCHALRHGSSVLCEKPLAATVRDARAMISAEAMSGHMVAIGYQWSFSESIQALKRDIIAGLFGRPIRFKSLVSFPRGLDYFSRNDWAGRIRTLTGDPVFDSPANNATAHYLHNMFYLLGSSTQTSAMPAIVQAELYRANDIESFDTAAIRAITEQDGVELLFYTSHAIPAKLGPIARYEFENAIVTYEAETHGGLIARFANGKIKRYGEPNRDRNQKIWQCVDAVRGNGTVVCGTSAAMAHTLCIAAAHASSPQVHALPPGMLSRQKMDSSSSVMVAAEGLHAALVQCYDQGILPSEHGGLDWAVRAAPVSIKENGVSDESSAPLKTIASHAESRVSN